MGSSRHNHNATPKQQRLHREQSAYDGVLSQEKYPRPDTSKGKSSSQSQRIPIWEIFDETSKNIEWGR
jgi:hypothetical protein